MQVSPILKMTKEKAFSLQFRWARATEEEIIAIVPLTLFSFGCSGGDSGGVLFIYSIVA